NLDALPVGAVTVTGDAFNGACSSVNAASVPTWVGAPVQATLTSSASTRVDLVLEKNGQAQVGVNFDDDGGAVDAAAPDAAVPDAAVPDAACAPDDANCNAAQAIFVATDGDDSAAGPAALRARAHRRMGSRAEHAAGLSFGTVR